MNKQVILRYHYKDVQRDYLKTAIPLVENITYEKGFDLNKHVKEVEMAKFIHNKLGGDITLINEKNTPNISTPDYIWLESYWDLKNISSAKACDSAIRHGLKQICDMLGGIILNFTSNDIDINESIQIIEKRMTRKGNIDISADSILIKGSKILKVLRYK